MKCRSHVEEVVGKETFRKRMTELYYRAVLAEMIHRQNYRTANNYLRNSWRYKPNLQTVVAILDGLLGFDLMSALKLYKYHCSLFW
jgi:hypothetical protein